MQFVESMNSNSVFAQSMLVNGDLFLQTAYLIAQQVFPHFPAQRSKQRPLLRKEKASFCSA